MDISELNGTYRITTISNQHSPIEKRSDGITELVGGKTYRKDNAGCIWRSEMTFINENTLSFVSTADPSDAADDFCLTNAHGDLTRDIVTFTAELNIARKGDKIKISGQIEHGAETIVITMMKQD